MIATIYEIDTGEFLWTIEGDPEVINAQTAGVRGWVEGRWDPATHYALNDEATLRPKLYINNPLSVAVGAPLTMPVPSNTQVYVDGVLEGAIGITTPLQFEVADEYDVRLAPPWPYVPKELKVVVTP